jgi:tRNA pseudouridine synthase 10
MIDAQSILSKYTQRLYELCDEAISKAWDIEWKSFLVQTTFDKKMLVLEDKIFDSKQLIDCMALKNLINRDAIKYISNKTKKEHSPSPDITFRIDFRKSEGLATPVNIYLFGHYLKNTRSYCQHDWSCSACRGKGCKQCNYKKENYPSIETALREHFAPAFKASDMKLHASGREDVDVMMLGSGRPAVVELLNPKKRHADLTKICAELKNSTPIEFLNPIYVQKFWIEAVCTSHFDKHYRATIHCDEGLSDSDWEKIDSSIPCTLAQRTPLRVSKRRADLIRRRRLYDIKLVSKRETDYVVDVWAEAGTYIKEMIHGDNNRTNPSISSILKKQCECTQLDVLSIDDSFLSTLRKQ